VVIASRPEIGESAPDCTLVGDAGPVTLSSLWSAQPLMLVLLPDEATPFCGDNAAQLRDFEHKFEEAGSKLIGVTTGDAAAIAAFRAQWNLAYPIFSDPSGQARAALGVDPGQPASFVIDAAGVIRYVHRGDGPDDFPPTHDLLNEVCTVTGKTIAEPPPPPPVHLDEPPMVVEQGAIVAGAFACAKCGFGSYEINRVSATSGWISRIFNFQLRGFTAITCGRCTYTELYKTEQGAFVNVLDILFGR
jgi:peroxiredoxin/predicted nucleic-acid-binding Zn-ribbon protein